MPLCRSRAGTKGDGYPAGVFVKGEWIIISLIVPLLDSRGVRGSEISHVRENFMIFVVLLGTLYFRIVY